ncbi:MAG: hypothetical protein KC419_26050 [Anaerolineales bacterium]|nr:hypothetical protein [Anaerolineales bacterium]
MTDNLIYSERVSSNKTEALFVTLTLIFFGLFIRRVNANKRAFLTGTFFFLFIFFFFCSVNYRTLIIRLTAESLMLTFGIFTWRVPWTNVAEYRPDELPFLLKFGGAGIHFMMVRKRYRVLFNFLEYPRVTIALKRKAGLAQDVSFSTRQPEVILRHIEERMSTF